MVKKVIRKKSGKSPKVLIVYTGGTIGMVHDPRTKTLKPFNFSNIISEIPELQKFQFQIEAISFRPAIDSSNFSPEHWVKLASLIEENYLEYDGFVILHGTDTLAYTASALSYMLENLSKPVILTGSQLPVKEIRTDAPENLITALEIASSKKNGKALVPEVAIYFDYKLFRGNRSSKYSSEKFEAFYSPNFPPLAEAGVNIQFHSGLITKHTTKKLKVHKDMAAKIGVLTVFPGISESWISGCLSIEGLSAVILESFGSGNVTTQKWFLKAISKAIKSGLIVLNISQCPAGKVIQGKYATSKSLRDIGVIGGADMTREAAVTKLMYLIGAGYSSKAVKLKVSRSLRGELTV